MKLAWIENEIIKDIAWTTPSEIYHPNIAINYSTEVSDDAENGDSWINGALVKKPVPVEPPAPPRQWSVDDFRNGLTLVEKVKWDNDSALEIITVKAELPKDKAGAIELVDFLVEAQVISQTSADKITE